MSAEAESVEECVRVNKNWEVKSRKWKRLDGKENTQPPPPVRTFVRGGGWQRCSNCGNSGHMYRKCVHPVTSIGIICFAPTSAEDKTLKMVFIRRKDSLAFSEIVRARYRVGDKAFIQKMLTDMTEAELDFLYNATNAGDVWSRLWSLKKEDDPSKTKRLETQRSLKKLQTLIDGEPKITSFREMIDELDLKKKWQEPEWGFPKGRRTLREDDKQCALREFYEETDINPDLVKILQVDPLEEVFVGSNGITYRHVYYLARCDTMVPLCVNPRNKTQKEEVSAIAWLDVQSVLERIRDTQPERKVVVARAIQIGSANLA